ncbi:sensor histidine kinase [Nocardiopsis lambiniae]|uniref:Sensor histidine kinase n=1 Tax=Nocardiopsis lambiniae TaxID=3075539 RepID=A0ABU2M691_9ACTN|nr:sensor histidine kinase [Nocardiopsis sp. DSM 44743]MDT0328184.1 sensor histidine kinase [Nocardiopsis sp. DSM 44743]
MDRPRDGGCGLGDVPDPLSHPGPTGRTAFLPGLLLTAGAVTDLFGGAPWPWLGGTGLLLFATLYAGVVTRDPTRPRRADRGVSIVLVVLTALAVVLSLAYGGTWVFLFMMAALACGTALPTVPLVGALIVLGGSAGVISGHRSDELWLPMVSGYGTFISGIMVAALLGLGETVRELSRTREELALAAVDRERLRFSRDLHDLLGHSMSVIVVKAEAVRRLAPRDAAAAAAQAADIEEVGRRSLTEIREAVSGYRESGLSHELDRARSALAGAGMTVTVRRSGPPPPTEAEAVLGWVVREAVTNAIRHSGASNVELVVAHEDGNARVTVTDDGCGRSPGPEGGHGLTGLGERLALAGGRLESGNAPGGGFRVSAELPTGPGAGGPAAGEGAGDGAGTVL